jgi:uncharacterized membrane protein YfcA
MTPLEFAAVAFLCSVVAGFLGSLLGVGGGIIVVPSLTLLLGVDIRFAIGASIVSVIATSSGAAASYVKEHLSNIRVGMLLEVATTAGALTGAFLAGRIGGGVLYIVFACVMIYTALSMLRFNHDGGRTDHISDRLADRLTLHGSYRDDSEGTEVKYRVRRTRVGLALSYAAGLISGLLGVGGGVIKVPAMNLVMGMPLKVATATSNFMIGVTGAASAGVYFSRGDVNPFITGPVAVGVVLGSTIGSRILSRIHSSLLRISFVLLLVWVAIQMLLKGVR